MLLTRSYNAKYAVFGVRAYLFSGGCVSKALRRILGSWVVYNFHIDELTVVHLPSVVPRVALTTEPKKRSKLSKRASAKQKKAKPVRGTGVVNLASSGSDEIGNEADLEYSSTEDECAQTFGPACYVSVPMEI